MKRWRRYSGAIAFGLVSSALLLTAAAAEVLPIYAGAKEIWKEVARSPAAAGQVAKRDLLSALQPTAEFSYNLNGDIGGTLVTWPYQTGYSRVCREDRVTLLYKPVDRFDPQGHFLNNRLEPVGVESGGPLFHIEQLPVPADDETRPPTTICDRSYPGTKAAWFSAGSAQDAVRAGNAFRMAEDQVKDGKLQPEVCERTGPDACRGWIVSLDDASKISTVSACSTSHGDDACYDIQLERDELTIVASIPVGDIIPTAIRSIEVREMPLIVGE